MGPVSLDMPINAVDSTDTAIGVLPRRKVFASGVGFRVIHVLVFNSKGELLLQQLSQTRERHPGYWGSSVAGYVFAGESYFEAADRRLVQELGVRARLSYLGKTHMNDSGCRKFIAVFRTIHDGPFEFDHGIIEQLRFELPDRLEESIERGTGLFTPTFLHVLQFLKEQHLLG